MYSAQNELNALGAIRFAVRASFESKRLIKLHFKRFPSLPLRDSPSSIPFDCGTPLIQGVPKEIIQVLLASNPNGNRYIANVTLGGYLSGTLKKSEPHILSAFKTQNH